MGVQAPMVVGTGQANGVVGLASAGVWCGERARWLVNPARDRLQNCLKWEFIPDCKNLISLWLGLVVITLRPSVAR